MTSPLIGENELGDRFHRFNRTEDSPGLERAADFGQLDVDDVAELLLRVVGDADFRRCRR